MDHTRYLSAVFNILVFYRLNVLILGTIISDHTPIPMEEDRTGIPFRDQQVLLSENLNSSRESLVVGISGILPGEYRYVCTATNDANATASIAVTLSIPGECARIQLIL